jgi:limonene-1,2-epoxide hydrolase
VAISVGIASAGDKTMSYEEALVYTAAPEVGHVEPESEAEKAAIERFSRFIGDMEAASIGKSAQQVYAEDAYFNDTIKELTGNEAIGTYLAESLEATERVEVEVVDVARSGIDYYYRWRMDIKFRNLNNGGWARSEGMSHIRFNAEGRVVLHRDYWDAAGGLFAYMPIIGSVLQWIKGRI